MKLLIEMIKKEKKYLKIILCYIEGDEIAKNLYSGLGFYLTGEVDEDEVLMEMNITENEYISECFDTKAEI